MKLTSQSYYGVRAVFDIAYHSEGSRIQTDAISKRQKIPSRYLQQIFQKLKRAGILDSKRGPSGGYFLMKRPEEITIGEIVRITEDGLVLVPCEGNKNSKKVCSRFDECVTRIIWKEAENRLKEYFDSVMIKYLCERATEMGLKRESNQNFVYQI